MLIPSQFLFHFSKAWLPSIQYRLTLLMNQIAIYPLNISEILKHTHIPAFSKTFIKNHAIRDTVKRIFFRVY